MSSKTMKAITFNASPSEIKIIEAVQKKNFRMNRSEVIRSLIQAGWEARNGKQNQKQ